MRQSNPSTPAWCTEPLPVMEHRPMEQKTGTGPSGSIHFRAGMAQR